MEKKRFPSDLQEQFMLRLPGGMRDRIRDAAEQAGRSMNAEIVATLEAAYPAPPTFNELQNRAMSLFAQVIGEKDPAKKERLKADLEAAQKAVEDALLDADEDREQP